jgi:small subunit ribosomal protein S6
VTPPAPTYDLIVLLDTQAEEQVRARVLEEVRSMIGSGGEMVRHDEWGERALTYPIARRTHAEYHLFQFHASTPQLLGELDRSLRIADGVLRFRVIKLKPGTPAAPELSGAGTSGRHADAPAPAPQAVAEHA